MKILAATLCGLILALGTLTMARADTGPFYAQLDDYVDCYAVYLAEDNLLYGLIAFPDGTESIIITGSFDGTNAFFHYTQDGYYFIQVFNIQTSEAKFYYLGDESLVSLGSASFTIGSCWQ